jgi:hypothetical protein
MSQGRDTKNSCQWLVVECNSLERIEHYLNIEQEPEPTTGGAPPAYWPASGDLIVKNLSARYSPVRIF